MDCYPTEGVTITDISAEINLQSLSDCTVRRLIKLQEEVLYTFEDNMFIENFEIIYKWGFDGVSGQKKYKHRSSDENPEELSVS